MSYEQEKRIIEYERRRELKTALLELQQLQMEKYRAELEERERAKNELRYRMKQNTTRYLIPKKKTKIAIRRATIKAARLDTYVFTQKQMEVAQRILDKMEGKTQ